MLLRSLLILLCGLGLCVPALAESAKVLTTIKPLQQIAAAVMDGVDTPAVLLPPGNSPHNYALRPSDRRALLDAERIYWVGPELELFLKDVLDRQGNAQALLHLPGMRVREQLQSINFQTEEGDHGHSHDHGHDHDHGALDSHIWLSPENAQQNARLKDRLEPLQDRAYFVFHDGYGYFEDHYGLRPRGIFSLSHEVQPGARHINLLRQQLQKAGASCVFSEPQFTPRLIDSLTRDLPVEKGELDPLGGGTDVSARGYEQSLESLAEQLAGCLEKL